MGSHHQENIENDPEISELDQNDTSMRSTRQEGGRWKLKLPVIFYKNIILHLPLSPNVTLL